MKFSRSRASDRRPSSSTGRFGKREINASAKSPRPLRKGGRSRSGDVPARL
jgi:hypothetical protein